MGAAAIPIFAGTSLLQAGEQVRAGKFAAQDAKVQEGQTALAAKQEEVGAIQREGDRKRRLAEAMASQNAMAGAGGIAAFEGSPLTVLQEDIRREEVATERDKFQTQGRVTQQSISGIAARSRGKFKGRSAKTGAGLGLLKDTTKVVGAV